MIHTYQDPYVLGSRAPALLIRSTVFPLCVFGGLVLLGLRWVNGDVVRAAWIIGPMLVPAYLYYRRLNHGQCSEIRLDGEGTCELGTRRRVIRLHVNEVGSVQYCRDSDGGSVSYLIRYRGGTLDVAERMTRFHDFLTRLKTLNPAVDLSTFPADAWPGLGASPTEERGTPARRSVLSGVFPLGVIAALVWLTYETFAGK